MTSTAERALRKAERALSQAQQAIDSVEVEPAAIEPAMRDAVREAMRRMGRNDRSCNEPVQAARDEERLKSAIIAGLVLFIGSAIVLFVARNIAARQARTRTARDTVQETGAEGLVAPWDRTPDDDDGAKSEVITG